MPKASKADRIFIFWGLVYLLAGIVIVVLRATIADLLNAEMGYVFLAGMILILLGIKDMFIMPLFTKDKKE